ncbi:MAG: PAS domain-containing protein [Candidatus Omnitrophica bacterium]|nr:PAS domain-containing protein [Candidatus Omnitrophota bacterium]
MSLSLEVIYIITAFIGIVIAISLINISRSSGHARIKKVLSTKKETEAIIRSIAAGLVVVDAKGKVVMMNPAAEKLLGTSKKDKIGQPVEDNLKQGQLVSLAKGSPDKDDRKIEVVSKEDETRKILCQSSAVIEDEDGQIVGMVSALSDVTKQRELDQLKADFVSNISHEFRTPIVTIQNSLFLLLNKKVGPVTQEQEKFLSLAQRNLKRLGDLIDDFLDLSKLEAAKMEMKYESHSIEKVINKACDSVMSRARSKNIRIEKRVQEGIPNVSLDFDRMAQVLDNIIGNAIKFTPKEGRIIVEGWTGEYKKNVFTAVTDTGLGISPEYLEKFFDKFQQMGERAVTYIGGTGLGLSIAKEIVELHGGKIWVESGQGQGAKFVFTLPIKKPQEAS